MLTIHNSRTDKTLTELLGTFLQVSAPYAPASYSLRQVAEGFSAWARHQPVSRLDRVYNHLVSGRLDPKLEELGLEA